MKYAVIMTGGKQYKVTEGNVIEVERFPSEEGKDVTFGDVLLYTADGVTNVGQPFVSNISVFGKILEHTKGEKLRVAKYKAKVRYRRVTGHRQALTKIMIESIGSAKENKEAAIKPEKKAMEKDAAISKEIKPKKSKKINKE